MSAPEKVNFRTVINNLSALVILLLSLWVLELLLGHKIEKNGLFGLGFLVISGLAAGRLCSIMGLPSLTGYLAAGLICGPSVFSIVDDSQVSQLSLMNTLALALIAMQAGCEFTTEMLQKNLKSLLHATWTHVVVIGIGTTLTLYLLSAFVDFFDGLSGYAVVAVSALFATIAISKSPAAVVAILSETKIKNKLSDHALGIVVILDIVVLILFSIALTFVKGSLDAHSSFSLSGLSHLFSEIIASIAAGTFFGLLIVAYFSLVDKEKILFIVAISYGLTALCSYLHYDTLLVFVVAGFVVTNFSNQSEKMVETIEALSSIVMIVFFATAGASLDLNALTGMWQLVLVLCVSRLILTWLSEKMAHSIAKSPVELKKYGYTPFISQAGLSIGLSIIIAERVPKIGPKLATLAISVVTINQIFGPILFEWGLKQVEKLKNSTQKPTEEITLN